MTCSKVPYRTRAAAVRAALGSSKTFGKGLRIYPCSECHALHLTSHVRNRRRKR